MTLLGIWLCVSHALSEYFLLAGGRRLLVLGLTPQSPLVAAAALTERTLNQEEQTLICFLRV